MNEWAGVAEFRKLKMRNDIEIDTVKVVVHGMWVEWYAQVDCSVCLHFILIVINWKSIGFYDHTFSVVRSSSHLNHASMWNLCFRNFVSALILWYYCIHGMWVEWYAQVDCSVCLHFILIVINWKSIRIYGHYFSVVRSSSQTRNHVPFLFPQLCWCPHLMILYSR
jgi:hypothetical protein